MTQDELTELWMSRIKDYQSRSSEERMADWCDRHQVTRHQLWYWIRKLKKAEQPTASASRSQWVSVSLDETASDECSPILVRVGGATIEVRPGFDLTLFADVVRTLKTLC